MGNSVILKGNYLKVSASGRFKSRSSDKLRKAKSKVILSSGNIYPFSQKILTDIAF